jgi:signal transduction histidine kinase
VVGDHGRLLQAVTNLISNACKFSPTGSTVTVAGAREDAFARISVADRGRGIAPEFRSRIFSRFAQADPSNKLSGAVGTGLGLAITKAIIERHQGEIGFTSEPGNGTLFWIRLPRILEEVS